MATYFTDFSEYADSSAPSDWSFPWNANDTWTVTGDPNYLYCNDPDSVQCLKWDDIDADAERQDFEIVYLWESSSGTASQAICRGSGSGGSGWYAYTLGSTNTAFRLYKHVNSTTLSQIATVAASFNADTKYWFRLRVNGSSLKGRYWADGSSEGSTWQLDTTDTDVTGDGFCGIRIGSSNAQNFKIHKWGGGSNGDTAPTSGSSTQSLTPGLYSNSQTFHAPTVSAGSVTLTPALFSNTQTFHAPTVSSTYGLTPALFSNTQTFHAPTVSSTYGLTPALFSNTQTFYAPTVSATYGLTPGLVSNTQTFHAPTVSQEGGAQYLVPDLVSNAQTFFAASVTPGTVTLAPELVSNAQTFHAPTVSNGFTLIAPLVSNDQLFYAPAIGTGAANLAPALLTNSQTFYAASVAGGAAAQALHTLRVPHESRALLIPHENRTRSIQ